MKVPECLYAYPAETSRDEHMSPTGICLRMPVGAYIGLRGSIWHYCNIHRSIVCDIVTAHCDTREFPLLDASVEEAYNIAQVYRVMCS